MADGHLNVCKECVKDRVRKYERRRRETDPEWRDKERARSIAKLLKKATKEWTREQYVLRKKRYRDAHTILSNAVRSGLVVPPSSCEDCGGDFSDFRREAHHEDYGKPLEVAWLCALCHGKRHRSF